VVFLIGTDLSAFFQMAGNPAVRLFEKKAGAPGARLARYSKYKINTVFNPETLVKNKDQSSKKTSFEN
jgi:hypothetical protein